MATDPVCGMMVNEATAAETFIHQGVTYYFCSVKCLNDFEKQPDDFVRTLTMLNPAPPAEEETESIALRWRHALGAGWRSLIGKITHHPR